MAARLLAARHSIRSFSSATSYTFDNLLLDNAFNLPKLPVPELQTTLDRYLESIKPISTEEEFANTSAACHEFLIGDGPRLQNQVLANSKGFGYPYSYMQEIWDDMYLGLRCSSMVNVNPGYIMQNEESQGQLERTSRFVLSLARWWEKVTSGQLEPDAQGGKVLCMTQFARVLGTARLPVAGMDQLHSTPRAAHVAVLRGGRAYAVDVVQAQEGGDGSAAFLSPQQLQSKLEEVVAMADAAPPSISPELPPGLTPCVLTAADRDVWAGARAEMAQSSAVNAQSLSIIDSALLVVCLEREQPTSLNRLSSAVLHGDGGKNRWFDKLQLLAFPEGQMALNFEHSHGDGQSWNRMLHEVWHDMQGSSSGFSPLPTAASAPDAAVAAAEGGVKELPFELSDAALSAITAAYSDSSALAGSVKTHAMEFDQFGKGSTKKWKLSPDAVMQMAFQLAYTTLHKTNPPTYESCATRRFFHGRTETIRSCTTASAAFTASMLSSSASPSQQLQLLHAAAAEHVALAGRAQGGQGVDRHLLALKMEALRDCDSSSDAQAQAGARLPSLFTDPLFSGSSAFALSTSNVTAPMLRLFNFGPVTPGGYGIGYMTFDDVMPVNVTSFAGAPNGADAETMAAAIANSLLRISSLPHADA